MIKIIVELVLFSIIFSKVFVFGEVIFVFLGFVCLVVLVFCGKIFFLEVWISVYLIVIIFKVMVVIMLFGVLYVKRLFDKGRKYYCDRSNWFWLFWWVIVVIVLWDVEEDVWYLVDYFLVFLC